MGFLGDIGEAIQKLDVAIDLEPRNSNYFSERGYAYAALGRYPEAISDLDYALRIDPKNLQALSRV